MATIEYLNTLTRAYISSDVDKHISPDETMNGEHYFEIGRSAIEAITVSCLASQLEKIETVLDLPCGHGRVLRHLVKFFPNANIYACDLDRKGVDYCSERFDAIRIYSTEGLTDTDFPTQFDLIWIGSLFTHTSKDVTLRWLKHLARYLSQKGIIVATVHGRWCEEVHKMFPYISEKSWKKILSEYKRTGYGYCDYSRNEEHLFIDGSYGVSLAKPHVTLNIIEQIPGVRIFLYKERGWADHQDIVAFGMPNYSKPWGQ